MHVILGNFIGYVISTIWHKYIILELCLFVDRCIWVVCKILCMYICIHACMYVHMYAGRQIWMSVCSYQAGVHVCVHGNSANMNKKFINSRNTKIWNYACLWMAAYKLYVCINECVSVCMYVHLWMYESMNACMLVWYPCSQVYVCVCLCACRHAWLCM